MGAPLFIAAAGFQAVGSYRSAQANKQALKYQAAVDANNALLAEMQAEDVLDQGHSDMLRHQGKVKAFRGKQIAAMSESGLAIGSETFSDILDSTDLLGDLDSIAILNNAERKAWGLQVEANNFRASSSMRSASAKSINPLFDAGTSLLGSWVGYEAMTGGFS